jgi:class 3 adenylate cyclase
MIISARKTERWGDHARRLAAILAADVAGYSCLMGEDEAGTALALREHRIATDLLVEQHGGRIVKTTGDGVLIEFGSVVGAVECTLALQQLTAERNASVPSDRRPAGVEAAKAGGRVVPMLPEAPPARSVNGHRAG